MRFDLGQYQIQIEIDSLYDSHSTDNQTIYTKQYLLGEESIVTQIGIRIFEYENEISSCIIGAEGGATTIHENSQIVENNKILICCNDSVFCLEIPTLNLSWKKEVDKTTAFQIFKHDKDYIIHGEFEITRIDEKGNIKWQNNGIDIFVSQNEKNDFEISEKNIKAVDYENRMELSFSNIGMTGGLRISYINKEKDDDITQIEKRCFIDGNSFIATEARFGGIVIEKEVE